MLALAVCFLAFGAIMAESPPMEEGPHVSNEDLAEFAAGENECGYTLAMHDGAQLLHQAFFDCVEGQEPTDELTEECNEVNFAATAQIWEDANTTEEEYNEALDCALDTLFAAIA